MKKKILAICLLAAMLIGSLGGISAFAEVRLEDCDRCFQTTVNSLIDGEDVDGTAITATRKPVYDLNLSHLGYVYEFEIASGKGYAIIIRGEEGYIAQEFVTSSESPYAALEEELCVYVNTMSYFKSIDGAICDINSSVALSEEAVAALKENAVLFKNDGVVDSDTEIVRVAYTSKSMDSDELNSDYPHYGNLSGLTGACAAVAGTNLIGYYDRFYEDLIPDHTAGYEIYGYYFYYSQDASVNSAMQQMYADMNGSSSGITENNFKSGLQTYCSRKNLTCEFTSIMSSGKLNYDSVKSSIKEGKPIAVLLSTFTICDVRSSGNTDTLDYRIYYGNHVMAGFKYRKITYTLSNGSTEKYQFIGVATGLSSLTTAYFNINYKVNINSAYKVNIH